MIDGQKAVYFILVLNPTKKTWMRVGNAYSSRESARDWQSFVRKFYRGLPSKISRCSLTFDNGRLDEKSKDKLDKKYNMYAKEFYQ